MSVRSEAGGARLIVFGRPGCHLCEEVVEQIEPLCRAAGIRMQVANVDERTDWRLRYGARIPVICAGDEELSAWPLDRTRIEAWLSSHS
jgi:thioredoxin reductase (NADPH)